MLKTKPQKEAELTIKGLRKFIHFKRDLLSDDSLVTLEQLIVDLKSARRERDDEKALELMADAEKLSEKLTPASEKRSGFLPENIEMLFVVIAVMIGIRAYIVQPFKIPTNSMYPTLNGMLAHGIDQSEPFPNIVSRTWERVWNGRNYIEIVAPFDGVMTVTDKSSLPLVSLANVRFFNPQTQQEENMTVNSTAGAILSANGFGLGERLVLLPGQTSPNSVEVKKGEVVVHGYSQAGDQLLVDKMSYHFRKPKRGEVFVFTTKRIPELVKDLRRVDPNIDMQHYIKRLVAVPGDRFEITDDNALMIDGKPAEEAGIRAVNSAEGDYNGYINWRPTRSGGRSRLPFSKGEVPSRKFVAMGDNSRNSKDSRFWGYVPEVNLVGPAFAVYFPFGNHFGGVE